MLRNLPYQVEKFFELQRFDLDVSKNLVQSPSATNLSLSDNSSNLNEKIEKFETMKQESQNLVNKDNPYMSNAELEEMVEKQKIVEEMAIAAQKAEEELKEQAQHQKRELEKERNSLLMLDEEQKSQFQENLRKQDK